MANYANNTSDILSTFNIKVTLMIDLESINLRNNKYNLRESFLKSFWKLKAVLLRENTNKQKSRFPNACHANKQTISFKNCANFVKPFAFY